MSCKNLPDFDILIELADFYEVDIKAHHVERVWLTGGTLLCMITALIINLIKIL